jgi:hypothetical protein
MHLDIISMMIKRISFIFSVDDRSPLHDMSTHSHHSHHSCHSYSGMGHQGHPPPSMPVGGGRRDSDLSDAFLSPEAYRATQAVEFIAEHLRNEDEYVQVGPTFLK